MIREDLLELKKSIERGREILKEGKQCQNSIFLWGKWILRKVPDLHDIAQEFDRSTTSIAKTVELFVMPDSLGEILRLKLVALELRNQSAQARPAISPRVGTSQQFGAIQNAVPAGLQPSVTGQPQNVPSQAQLLLQAAQRTQYPTFSPTKPAAQARIVPIPTTQSRVPPLPTTQSRIPPLPTTQSRIAPVPTSGVQQQNSPSAPDPRKKKL